MKNIALGIILVITLISVTGQISQASDTGSGPSWQKIGATVGGLTAVGGLGYKAYQWRQLYNKQQEENAFFNASKKQYDDIIVKLKADLQIFQESLDVKVVAYLKESNAFFYKSEKLLEKYTALQDKINSFLKSNFKSESESILYELSQYELQIEKRKEALNIERLKLFEHFKRLLQQLEQYCGRYLIDMNKELKIFDATYLATLKDSNVLLAQEGEDATGEYLKIEIAAHDKIKEYEERHDSYLTKLYKRGKGLLSGVVAPVAKKPGIANPVVAVTV